MRAGDLGGDIQAQTLLRGSYLTPHERQKQALFGGRGNRLTGIGTRQLEDAAAAGGAHRNRLRRRAVSQRVAESVKRVFRVRRRLRFCCFCGNQ